MPQHKPQQFVNRISLRLRVQQLLTTRLQQLPILNTRRTCLLARPATQTTIYMRGKRRGRILQPSLGHRSHQIDPPAWSIILVPRDHVRRTRFQAQPAMNTREQFLFFSGERRGDVCLGDWLQCVISIQLPGRRCGAGR